MTPARKPQPGTEPELEAVEELVTILRARPGDFAGVPAMAKSSGLGTSKLEVLFRRHFHVTPARELASARMAAARRGLVETNRSIEALAAETGYPSLTTFERRFERANGLSPEAYRGLRGAREFGFALPKALPLARSLAFLGRDPASLTERVDGDRFEAGLLLAGKPARLDVKLKPGRARCTIHSRSRLREDAAALAHDYLLRRIGLQADPAPFERQVRADAELRGLTQGRRGLRVPRTGDAFECLAWTVAGQQISLPFARTLFGRLVERAGRRVGAGLYTPPEPERVANLSLDELTAVQFSRRKAEYIVDAAGLIAEGSLPLAALGEGSATRAEEALLAVRGIGPWSAHYLMMRGYGFEDCVPVGDAGLVRALAHFFDLPQRPGPAETLELMERFRPYRTFATFHLWMSLEDL